ncbi:sigma-54 interaction domain-containing protein [Roseateles chitinivorans]|uniref:sigma-54 interaction domain-containing protein n=1 Tax=Roseateles chitinivorans TaxID=2917965 RepID=UPI003D679F01
MSTPTKARPGTLDAMLVGRSAGLRKALDLVARYADCAAPVLVVGETGTGKELVARAIHYLGPRRDGAFIPVNCGALPDTLIESELFGHARGAFTDAARTRRGLVREAEGGTLFLDEIEALSPRGQVVLLRFLQDASFRAVGDDQTHQADVRVVAACNVDLFSLSQQGGFRSDLFFRLDVLRVDLPPLRERPEDLDLLVPHLLRGMAQATTGPPKAISDEALALLRSLSWPGNVRELEHTLVRASLSTTEGCIDVDTLLTSSPGLREAAQRSGERGHDRGCASLREAKRAAVVNVERQFVMEAMAVGNGNISEAARLCNMQRATLSKLVKKHGDALACRDRAATKPADAGRSLYLTSTLPTIPASK